MDRLRRIENNLFRILMACLEIDMKEIILQPQPRCMAAPLRLLRVTPLVGEGVTDDVAPAKEYQSDRQAPLNTPGTPQGAKSFNWRRGNDSVLSFGYSRVQ